jgi:hypothetical protein
MGILMIKGILLVGSGVYLQISGLCVSVKNNLVGLAEVMLDNKPFQ